MFDMLFYSSLFFSVYPFIHYMLMLMHLLNIKFSPKFDNVMMWQNCVLLRRGLVTYLREKKNICLNCFFETNLMLDGVELLILQFNSRLTLCVGRFYCNPIRCEQQHVFPTTIVSAMRQKIHSILNFALWIKKKSCNLFSVISF